MKPALWRTNYRRASFTRAPEGPRGGKMSMLRRFSFILMAMSWLLAGAAMAQPKSVTLWHVFNLETDMIYGGIKSFNETQTAYRIDARLVPANQLGAGLIKAA